MVGTEEPIPQEHRCGEHAEERGHDGGYVDVALEPCHSPGTTPRGVRGYGRVDDFGGGPDGRSGGGPENRGPPLEAHEEICQTQA